MRYGSWREDDAEGGSQVREPAQQRRRFGYRRLHILLREGVVINRKKTQRLFREEKLAAGVKPGVPHLSPDHILASRGGYLHLDAIVPGLKSRFVAEYVTDVQGNAKRRCAELFDERRAQRFPANRTPA